MANRYPNLSPAESDDLYETLGEYLEKEYNKTLENSRKQPKNTTDRVAKAIFFLTKDMDVPRTLSDNYRTD